MAGEKTKMKHMELYRFTRRGHGPEYAVLDSDLPVPVAEAANRIGAAYKRYMGRDIEIMAIEHIDMVFVEVPDGR